MSAAMRAKRCKCMNPFTYEGERELGKCSFLGCGWSDCEIGETNPIGEVVTARELLASSAWVPRIRGRVNVKLPKWCLSLALPVAGISVAVSPQVAWAQDHVVPLQELH